jgi:hypothetical protein
VPATPDSLAGGGAPIRALDWSTKPLDPAEGWPQSLRIAVRLTSRHPICEPGPTYVSRLARLAADRADDAEKAG